MESPGSQTSVPASAPGRGSEVGPGLRKVRPIEASRKFETGDLETQKANKTFNHPISVTIPTGYSATDFEVPHKIGKIPVDIVFGARSSNVTIWRGIKEWTRTAIYLRAGDAVTVTLYLVP